MPIAPSKKISVASTAIAVLGILFVVTNCVAVTKNMVACIDAIMRVTRAGGDPSQAGAVAGEAVIEAVSRIVFLGLAAIVPATLLYLALVPMRLRARWFYASTLITCLYLLVLLPFGTVSGFVLLAELRRRRGEFVNNETSTTEVTSALQTPSSRSFQSNAETEAADGKTPDTPLAPIIGHASNSTAKVSCNMTLLALFTFTAVIALVVYSRTSANTQPDLKASVSEIRHYTDSFNGLTIKSVRSRLAGAKVNEEEWNGNVSGDTQLVATFPEYQIRVFFSENKAITTSFQIISK